ncbi:hypothetical protein LUZ61_013872 [Rhynchospora tenuis]|uniref:DEK-C domain-containing protein n=1 Tax=Rhynchospora tenuis TaxID=198213 RepID=A0AAD5WD13_9POAL|nr:hypothetical protein LUZ61_013872 [Rhynchospora tenuis]
MASDDAETEKRIEEAVLDILKESDMASMTESKVRSEAAKRLGLDLSVRHRKKFVRKVVESFLTTKEEEAEKEKVKEVQEEVEEGEEEVGEEEEEEEEETDKRVLGNRQYECDDSGDPIICALSSKRRVTLQEFRGKTLVSIREFYEKDGKQLPSSKGISLTVEQWEAFRNAVPAIEDAIKQVGGSTD